ncbi:MAG: hypothetical protein M1833_002921 [Piccolia ochrophora]|nr:MAG: hypothetical protein M1833_002921 [Piccolia ochrophora]
MRQGGKEEHDDEDEQKQKQEARARWNGETDERTNHQRDDSSKSLAREQNSLVGVASEAGPGEGGKRDKEGSAEWARQQQRIATPTSVRPKSAIFGSPLSDNLSPGHGHSQSFTSLSSALSPRPSTNARTNSTPTSNTFAPRFIKSDEVTQSQSQVRAIEGENDFSGKRYVWLKDPETAFVRGWVVEQEEGGRLLVQCDDGSQREVDDENVDKVNPAKFDKAGDMAELTHLNEASVVHNLHMRYQADLIYTYSGLFLVTVNPYCPLPIYTNEYINMYRGQSREDTKPHIYAMADEAFRNLVDEGQNQSILVTGESGAGKTENTKKVIQYLAAVASTDPSSIKAGPKQLSNLSQQILRANPILESFGNAQTVRNNNSSRFGKFIRIEFTRLGQIAGAYIDWYLLEKSRVVHLSSNERNYHVFYQLLRGADRRTKNDFCIGDMDVEDFEYTKHGNDTITGVSDRDEWSSLMEAFNIMGFSDQEQSSVLRTVAGVLHLGNLRVVKESARADQARLSPESQAPLEKACHLLGVPVEPFIQGLLHPRVRAGREWVEKVQTPEQVRLAVDALAKSIYERGFGDLVDRINRQLDRAGMGLDDSHFIGVLDIAGFEIFEANSFEQLCINYTNEKLQQFFNHHMFVLEQEEYAREQIEWKFIDFGKDLQPTIDLIELPNPIGIFSCLDEDSVMPKATDKTFTDKLHSLWDRKTPKYRRSLLTQGFILTHYAAEVEYSTDGWLEKNKDPLNDNLTKLLAASKDQHIAKLFADCAEADDDHVASRSKVKKGLFRTVAQRHKEQLSSLMGQLHSTHPHFVRCIIPNHKKRPKQFSAPLVLDQLRCNGVLEGIRIARTGFPNRLPFSEFRQRYEVLCRKMPTGYLEGQSAVQIMLEQLDLDSALYRVGLTKVFLRAGVLAELEEQRDSLIREIMSRFQSVARGFTQRRIAHKRLYRAEAARIIQGNFRVYLDLCENPWWKLFVQMKPLLGATRASGEVKKRDEMINKLEVKMQQEAAERQRVEEERRRADLEFQRVQQVLEGERALALDKEEIFKRLQQRETELTEKLAGALEDQENLEDQLDELLLAKKRAEDDADSRRMQLEQAGQIIGSLEGEKRRLSEQLASLAAQSAAVEQSRSEKDALHEALSQEIKMLTSQLSLKERKMQDLETKLLKTDQDLDVKLANSTKELQVSKKQIKELLDENRLVRSQLSDLSSTSTGYEDLMRRKESELSVLRSDLKKFEGEHEKHTQERASLSTRHDGIQNRLREVQAQMEALKSQKSQAEREAADAKRVLEARISADAQAGQGRKILEEQITDLKTQLFQVQAELSRERQSRDDVQLLGEHKLASLKDEYDTLNESKITIEKELYVQQDTLRHSIETKASAEKDRKELQAQLRKLRERFSELENSRLQTESVIEQSMTRQANERYASLRKDLDASESRLQDSDSERCRLSAEVERLTQIITDSDLFRSKHDHEKERLERELVTIRGRLTASENDNRALLNKIQQKNLDIARSNSRVGDTQRSRMAGLQADKVKADEQVRNLQKQLGDAQISITSLEKQKEKLSLDLEDLNHEVTREHKTSRSAEKASSTSNAHLVEASRNLLNERQLKVQAQENTHKVQASLDQANAELTSCHNQLLLLQKVFDPEATTPATWDAGKRAISNSVDLAQKLQDSEQALRISTERCSRAETQLMEIRKRHHSDILDMDERHSSSKRHLLEELEQNNLPFSRSPKQGRNAVEVKHYSNPSTPVRRHMSNGTTATHDSNRSDKTIDTISYQKRMDMAAELEEVQNQLQMTEMQNRHLQSQLNRSTPTRDMWQDESPSTRRMQKLERENNRLHDMLDDSAKKVSSLEKNIHSGELSFRDIQAKSHEELYDLINGQENSRRSLVQVHNNTLTELAEAKQHFDKVKQAKTTLEVELRDLRSEIQDLAETREQEARSRSHLVEECSDLQIRLDAELSRADDMAASLNLYKSRADEYFSKLEQAEIAVLKASRAEQFAKAQGKEAEDTCAVIMAERKQMESTIDDLQRQNQLFDEKVEDMSADLDGALQAKKRLHHELEDYRNRRAMDIEDKETSMEQTRRKYQSELSTMNNEIEIERESVIHVRTENSRLREELEDLRSKWDDEVLNSSTWAKEKSRLEITLQDLSNSRDEAVSAHNDAQSRIVSLLSQVRNLRTSVDDVAAERDVLFKEKRGLEARLTEANDRLEDLVQGGSPSLRNAAGMDRELLELKSSLAQKEDVAAAAVGKMRRAESLVAEVQKDITSERETNGQLHKEKAALEKSVKELQLKLVDFETKTYSSASQDVRFLHGRVQELERQLDAQEAERNKSQRSVRNVDRTVRDLQSQIERRDKTNTQLSEEVSKHRDKVERLLQTIDELQSSDSDSQLSARRAERELREEREKALKLQQELQGWKGMRGERGSLARSGTFTPSGHSEREGEAGSRRSSALHRLPSNSKGFL